MLFEVVVRCAVFIACCSLFVDRLLVVVNWLLFRRVMFDVGCVVCCLFLVLFV